MQKKVKLGDIATLITKGTTPTSIGYSFVDSGVNFIKIESLNDQGGFISEKFAFISEDCNAKMQRSQLHENDILFSIAGAIGKKAVVSNNILPANTNQALAIIRIPKGKINHQYLFYALESDGIKKQFEKQKQGVAQLNLSLKDISELEINLVSQEEQDKTVAVIGNVDKLIDKRKQQFQKLDELVKARFVEMFGDPVNNTLGWEEHCLDEYIEFLTSGSRGWAQYFNDNGSEIFITIKNVKNNNIVLDGIQRIDAPNNKEAERTKVQSGDLLISITADLGRTGVVDETISNSSAYINQHLSLIRLNKMIINPMYVSYFLETEGGKRQFAIKNQSAVKAGLNFEAIKSLKILVPPIEIQNKFVDFVQQIDKSKLHVQKSLDKLEILKKALMQKYFG